MGIATHLARTLKNWLRSRPRLEIEESATWFLLLFVYAHGLTTDGLGWSRPVKWCKQCVILMMLSKPQLVERVLPPAELRRARGVQA